MKKLCERNHLLMAVLLSVVYVLFCLTLNSQAATLWSGDVIPTDPTTWTASTNGYIGKTTAGEVTVDGGSGLLSYAVYLGYASGSTGTAKITGSGSYCNSGILEIGCSGNGTLNIEQGGVVVTSGSGSIGESAGSVGAATVTGIGSTWKADTVLAVGDYGVRTLNVTNGGSVKSSGFVYIGHFHGSQGAVKVDGAGSQLYCASHPTDIGTLGSGTLEITNGGIVNLYQGYIGHSSDATGTVTVDGVNSQLINSYQLYIGTSGNTGGGNGTLNISNGGSVTAGGATYVGSAFASTGSINFGSGGGTLTTASLIASPDSLTGMGTINTRGLVSDIDLVFDANHPLVQVLQINNIAVNLDMSNSRVNGTLGVGCGGNGSLTIRNTTVASADGFVGYRTGSVGVATVDGIGSKWNCLGQLNIGNSGKGTLNILGNGIASVGATCNIGYNTSSTGKVNVAGADSMLSINGNLYIGYSGNGSLNVSGGASVATAYDTFIAYSNGSSGSINFGTGGGTIETRTLFASPSQITGIGALNVYGLVSDINLVFDSTHGLVQSVSCNEATVNIDLSKNAPAIGYLGAGYLGNGSLTIQEGVAVTSGDGYVGFQQGSLGLVTVDGAGSAWSTGILNVGYNGNGVLNITGGGCVTDSIGNIGHHSISKGIVKVDGQNSQWINSQSVGIGFLFTTMNSAILTITGGGTVRTNGIWLYTRNSLVAIDVGTGSKLNINNGSGPLSNLGIVRILAGAKATANATYSPISAGTWSGSGVYQPVGGTWNATTHEFTVSGVQPGDSGVPVTIDRLSTQRMLIGNGPADWVLGASLAATNVSSSLTLTATAIGDEPRVALTGLLSAGDSLLGGWNLSSSSGYTAGDPLYLSFGNGTDIGTSSRYMQVWSYDGTTWSKFDAPDLTSNGSYASFTATALGCYAVTVPEPGTALLLIFALAGLATIARRRA